jgi:hypothetical protein
MDPEIRESIMGHWFRGRSVTERYGRISDEELIRAMDSMTFDHGNTEILISEGKKEKTAKGGTPCRNFRVQHAYKSASEQKSGKRWIFPSS